jgi:hypothetical protein
VSSFLDSGTRRSAPADLIGSFRTAPEPFIQDGLRSRIDAGGFRGPFQEQSACRLPDRMMMMLEAAQGMACVCRRYYLTRQGDEAGRCRFYIGLAECGKTATKRGSPRANELYVTAIARQSLCTLHHDGLQIHLYKLLLQSPCPIIDA